MRAGFTYMIHTFIFGIEEGFYPPVVEASSDPRSSQCKNLDDQASLLIALQSSRNWSWAISILFQMN